MRVEPRTSLLRRTPDDSDPVERAVVANAEVLVVVTALADPVPRPRLVDRCLVAAYDGGLVPLLCLTKDDLAPPDELRGALRAARRRGRRHRPRRRRPRRRGAARAARRPHQRAVRAVRRRQVARWSTGWCRTPTGPSATVTGVGKGRHVSSSAVALELPGGGTVIDTPGVRSFGLGAVTPDRVLAAFPDLARGGGRVPAGLRPPRGHARLRARRRGRGRAGRARRGWTRCAGCWSPCSRRRTERYDPAGTWAPPPEGRTTTTRSLRRSLRCCSALNICVCAVAQDRDDEVVAGPRRQADLLAQDVALGELEALPGHEQVLEDGAGRRARRGDAEQPAGRLGRHDDAVGPAVAQQRRVLRLADGRDDVGARGCAGARSA